MVSTATRPVPRRVRATAAVIALVAVAGCHPVHQELPLPALVGTPDATSELIGCDQADTAVTVTGDAHLDPACTYTRTVTISTSGVTLDCRGATIEDLTGAQSRGILVSSPTTSALTDVTVRNCVVKGFLNNVRVTRPGFKQLEAGHEYEHAFSDIVIENSHLYRSRGSGIFVDGYVTGVTMRGLDISGSGSVGVYLEAGSKDNVIEDSDIHNNGFAQTGPEGVPIVVGGVELRYEHTGREGIAVDGSRDNVIRNNRIAGNSNGAILLYKNCGEYATEQPGQWWTRRYGAEGNLIEGNVISNERHGVWIGSRMSENQLFMDCSDPFYDAGPVHRIHLDHAAGNTVRGNVFGSVEHGVRIEDDDNVVSGNLFLSTDPAHRAIVLGTKPRTELLGHPVTGSVITGNQSEIDGNPQPYGWAFGHDATTFDSNTAGGSEATLVEAPHPPIDVHLFARRLWVP